ncbi:MAG: substrate-binding domain-containing protein [Chloroflexi bacterium]|nr:substrate-binding domain-containing protein [Chloroflexota bacterium]
MTIHITRVLAIISLILLLSLFAPACRATPTPLPNVHFRIGSADSTQYIAREAAAAYRRAHPGATFDFFTTNSTMSLRQFAFGQYDLTFVERNPRADELERARATAFELGRDGVYVIVHPSNPLQHITRDDLRKILSGEIYRWSQLNLEPPGGQDSIQVLVREDGSGMRAVIEEKIMRGARTTPTALLQPTNLDMLDYVSEHPNSIGYVAANIWDNNAHTRPLGIDGSTPARESIAAGTYPLVQTVFLIVPQTPNPNVNSFVEFLASDDGRAALYRRISALPPK